jgi:hypothetical protein
MFPFIPRITDPFKLTEELKEAVAPNVEEPV